VPAGKVQLYGLDALWRTHAEARDETAGIDAGVDVGSRIVRRLRDAESDYAGARHASPQRRELVVRIDDRGVLGIQVRDHLALGASRAFDGAEAFEMLGPGIRDQSHRGPRQLAQRGDLTRMIGAHFDDGETVHGVEPVQGQRHADVIVETASGVQRGAGARQNCRDHLLAGGLAIAAGHADHGNLELRAPGARGALQRLQRVGHQDLRQGPRHLRVDHRAGGTSELRRAHEFIGIESRATQGDEQFTGLDRPGVARNAAVFTLVHASGAE
jgi:hypothetical protein